MDEPSQNPYKVPPASGPTDPGAIRVARRHEKILRRWEAFWSLVRKLGAAAPDRAIPAFMFALVICAVSLIAWCDERLDAGRRAQCHDICTTLGAEGSVGEYFRSCNCVDLDQGLVPVSRYKPTRISD